MPPGELGNEGGGSDESQFVGYYEHRYKPEQTAMEDDRFVQEKEDSKKRLTQQERLIRKWKKKMCQPEPKSSGLPDGGPTPGVK